MQIIAELVIREVALISLYERFNPGTILMQSFGIMAMPIPRLAHNKIVRVSSTLQSDIWLKADISTSFSND